MLIPRSYSYYPGCSLRSTAWEFDAATRAVFARIGANLVELSDWNCCGASSGHSVSPYLAHALPLRNLILAEERDAEVLVPCAACYNRLRLTQEFLACEHPSAATLSRDLEHVMGRPYRGRVVVRHVLEVLSAAAVLEAIRELVSCPLKDLSVAAYYGCLLNRPAGVSFEENPEQPRAMEQILEALGASPVSWPGRTECCGAFLGIARPDLVRHLVAGLVSSARRAGAQALVTACPACQTNLDGRQGSRAGMPVFFVSELVGMGFGLEEAGKWWGGHLVDPRPVIAVLRR